MANALVNSFRNGILGAHSTYVDLDADTIRAMFVDGGDITPLVTHDFIDDITGAGRVPAIASCPALGSKTIGVVGTGVFDAANTTFTALTGDQVEYLILFKDSGGAENTMNLIAIWDSATGLPLTPNGGDVTVTWAGGGILSV